MSGAPKRPHDDGGHSSSSKYPHDDSSPYRKISSSLPVQYRPSFEMGQDTPMSKIPRTESRDGDRRSPLHSIFRMPSSSNDPHVDHSVASESRPELRDSKDGADNRFENRESRVERELFGDERRDSQAVKLEKEMRYEGRLDDIKEMKYDRDSYSDYKGELKSEKEIYGSATSHMNWKESKDYHRGKRYPETSVGSLEPWHVSRTSSQSATEAVKDALTTDEKDYVETREAVGENKIDSKGEDKFKEKDRKRKDTKQRDWGDKDKERNDHRNSTQATNTNVEPKDLSKEERDAERWERDRKDTSKDKERPRERDKDHAAKRESWNGMDKETAHIEKESGEVSARMLEQDNPISDQKKQKEFDSWKNADREGRDRKKERDADIEGDRPEKRSRCHEKESDEGCADVEGTLDRDREVYNYGVQHRRRMQRSRGSPQVANREPRFRSRAQDNEGLQGKSEVSSVIYKVGECMQELIKLWKEHESSQIDKNGESSQNIPTLEIRIPAEHVIATNRQVRGGQLWGTDVYTYDSDLVAVLMHTGYCRLTASPPPPAIQELRATIRVLPPQDCYISTLRNNVRSRAWGAAIGCSYCVERCCIVKKGGGAIDLEPCLTHTSAVEPTLAPVAVERTMTTRAAASNALRQQRFVREVTIQYNLCNEPWIKYSISIVADKGLKKPLYTSARLKKGEVLYLETHSCRYELCFSGEKMVKTIASSQGHETEAEKSQNHFLNCPNGERTDNDNTLIDVFRWSRCKKPLPQKVMRSIGIPLPSEHVEVLEDNLDWEDVQWSQTGVWIAGKEYQLARVHFLSMN
ncbi:zinc finger CCCH domain-containing protein 13 [Cucumis sativus]|uniref:Histone deacetylation protein Rxt3 n=1 Tax=Cucumis sativus TaxID=3659 RepID=A0A0A0LJZ2_CUCSA|nr:zinc finger CCCH domain-containing protein 13 [Cucumis sativus]XP_011649443.1 zinc finger CCCH domain-containing protein 13 [Cucumis sativus]XP_011649444.1 zinc finger CCCH domain-containing protein 13 [Cucumis sativus]XP_011649445.1 zinc finger CCCH domain-containing protein 13 [Cucumis sativus]KGN62230.1 hypothetical protein Csa_016917 [Cucumis sativus]